MGLRDKQLTHARTLLEERVQGAKDAVERIQSLIEGHDFSLAAELASDLGPKLMRANALANILADMEA